MIKKRLNVHSIYQLRCLFIMYDGNWLEGYLKKTLELVNADIGHPIWLPMLEWLLKWRGSTWFSSWLKTKVAFFRPHICSLRAARGRIFSSQSACLESSVSLSLSFSAATLSQYIDTHSNIELPAHAEGGKK